MTPCVQVETSPKLISVDDCSIEINCCYRRCWWTNNTDDRMIDFAENYVDVILCACRDLTYTQTYVQSMVELITLVR